MTVKSAYLIACLKKKFLFEYVQCIYQLQHCCRKFFWRYAQMHSLSSKKYCVWDIYYQDILKWTMTKTIFDAWKNIKLRSCPLTWRAVGIKMIWWWVGVKGSKISMRFKVLFVYFWWQTMHQRINNNVKFYDILLLSHL